MSGVPRMIRLPWAPGLYWRPCAMDLCDRWYFDDKDRACRRCVHELVALMCLEALGVLA